MIKMIDTSKAGSKRPYFLKAWTIKRKIGTNGVRWKILYQVGFLEQYCYVVRAQVYVVLKVNYFQSQIFNLTFYDGSIEF